MSIKNEANVACKCAKPSYRQTLGIAQNNVSLAFLFTSFWQKFSTMGRLN